VKNLAAQESLLLRIGGDKGCAMEEKLFNCHFSMDFLNWTSA
jgi:hypothetical protein